MASPEQPPLPLLFLIGDTGGGHRSAAAAVAQALEHLLPGRFVPVICDPLRGPDVPRLLRWFSGLYGPCIRLTPWLWWLFWRASDSPRVLGAVRRTVMAPVYGSVARAAEACRPALIVAFHPMTADPAVRARDLAGALSPVITVITDLITAHLSWRDAAVDRVVVPSAEVGDRGGQGGEAARPLRAARAAGRRRVLRAAARRGRAEGTQARTRRQRGLPRRADRGRGRQRRAAPPRRRDPPPGGRRRGRGHLRPQPLPQPARLPARRAGRPARARSRRRPAAARRWYSPRSSPARRRATPSSSPARAPGFTRRGPAS